MARRKANLYDMLPLTSKKRAERKAKRKKTAGVAAGVVQQVPHRSSWYLVGSKVWQGNT